MLRWHDFPARLFSYASGLFVAFFGFSNFTPGPGLRPSKQSVLHQDSHSYDFLEAINPKSNATVKLYFNVDIPFKHYLN